MFSKGQLIFALVFLIGFIIAITFAYRKDKTGNTAFFKGSYKILLVALLIFIALFSLVKLKHFFIH